MNYEIVQEHEYQDIYRLCYGVLLIVNKYKSIKSGWYWSYTDKNKKSLKKVSDLKKCYILQKDVSVTIPDAVIPKGSIIFNDEVIEPITNKKDFYYELKTTGSCFSGNFDEFKNLNDTVSDIITNRY